MAKRVDVDRLYAALDAERQDRGMSWRQVAAEADVSSSLFTRMAKGHSLDVESFAALVQWLGVHAEVFMNAASHVKTKVSVGAEVALLLRARPDLSREDQEYLVQLINATTQYLKSRQQES